MDYWYILFVITGLEKKAAAEINHFYNQDDLFSFVPLLEEYHKYANGKVEKKVKAMFPGYVFVETELGSIDFRKCIRNYLYKSNTAIKILKYGDSYEIAVREHEKEGLLALCNQDYRVEASKGIMVGDKVFVTEGALKGHESVIKKIDRHNKKAMIQAEIMGRTVQVKVGLEIVEKVPSCNRVR